MINIAILIMFLLVFVNCKKDKLCKDDELSLQRIDYVGTQLRIDGYYYEDLSESPEQKYTSVLFLYQDGIYLGSSGYDINAAILGEMNIEQINSALKSKAAWGIFQINGNIIEIEHWTPSMQGCFNTLYEKGEIKSDTTFIITKREYRENGSASKTETPNSTFYFRPLDAKPDSTNTFIKQ